MLKSNPTAGPVGQSDPMSGSPGSVIVNSPVIQPDSIVIWSRATAGGDLGEVSITDQSLGSFTLTSTTIETSTFNYSIVNL